MKLKCNDFSSFSDYIIENNQSVVLFGAGAIGQITAPEILREYGVLNNVE